MNSTLVMRSIGRQGGTVWTVWCMCAKLHVRLSTLRMDVEIQRIESNVISELSQYEKLCKHAKEEVKNTLAARDRENARRKQLDRLRERNPRNRPQITAAQVELSKASMEVANNMKWLEEQMDHFEKKKLQDIRSLLLSYITAELSFHVKAVELFTKGYNDIANINVNTDLEEFQSFLQDPESSSRLETVKRTSLRQSIANLFATPPSSKRPEQNEPQTTVKVSHHIHFLFYDIKPTENPKNMKKDYV
ncbi:Uncharacterized protein GBIM_08397 [Gryllus bimaculatus]|nr:Uncharacterized protein GBIM_08397 [Gryllus bimaculatus]